MLAQFDFGPHWSFIVASYAFAVLGVGALLIWIFADYRALKRSLAQMEAQGLRRRSQQGGGEHDGSA